MSKANPSTGTSRRKFITTLGLGGAAAAAAVVLNKGAEPDQKLASKQEKTGDKREGYQLTSHIRNYYRTTQV